MTKTLAELRPGDPVECCFLINLNPPALRGKKYDEPFEEALIEERWLPAVITYIDAHEIVATFSDGERRSYPTRQRPNQPAQIRSTR